jgi:hypothetical protein
MRISSIGTVYRDGRETLIDFEAEQIPEERPSKTSFRISSQRSTPLASPVIAAEKGAMPATRPTARRLRRTRKYTTLEKSFLRLIASGMWVGSTCRDHGRSIRIRSIWQGVEMAPRSSSMSKLRK